MLSALLSALLLTLAFPKFSLWPVAWFAFLPMFFLSVERKRLRDAFGCYYLFGFLFFFVSVEWLRHVAMVGWFFVPFLFAFLFGIFGVLVQWLWNRKVILLSIFLIPSAWVVLEWIRAEIPVWAFGWNLLAYSQSEFLPVARMASLVGAFGVSWLVMLGNVTTFFLVKALRQEKKKDEKASVLAVGLLAFCIVGLLLGVHATLSDEGETHSVRVSVIQGNIAQEVKWLPTSAPEILSTYEGLSEMSNVHQPDLIVWPEATFPGFLNQHPLRERVAQFQKKLKTPLLLGALYVAENEEMFNSAYFSENGTFSDRYDKVRLVPFGEFVPLKSFFGLLGLQPFADSMGIGDYSFGVDLKVFDLPNVRATNASPVRFSPLICFEDTFPSLARRAVQKGAQFLVVITNDAWFSESAAPYQHLQASVFRAIENAIPVVRSANTGVSAFISASGKVLDRVKNKYGHDIFVMGGLVRPVKLTERATVYQAAGHWFPVGCVVFVFAGILLQRVVVKKR